jgi:hypothetical protein
MITVYHALSGHCSCYLPDDARHAAPSSSLQLDVNALEGFIERLWLMSVDMSSGCLPQMKGASLSFLVCFSSTAAEAGEVSRSPILFSVNPVVFDLSCSSIHRGRATQGSPPGVRAAAAVEGEEGRGSDRSGGLKNDEGACVSHGICLVDFPTVRSVLFCLWCSWGGCEVEENRDLEEIR